MARDRILSGRALLAERLGCSPRTVSRLVAKGKLKGAYKLGGRTSPVKMTEGALARYRRAKPGPKGKG